MSIIIDNLANPVARQGSNQDQIENLAVMALLERIREPVRKAMRHSTRARRARFLNLDDVPFLMEQPLGLKILRQAEARVLRHVRFHKIDEKNKIAVDSLARDFTLTTLQACRHLRRQLEPVKLPKRPKVQPQPLNVYPGWMDFDLVA